MDEERNFKYSSLGTYGTSGYMTEVEKKQVLREERDVKETKGIILGTDLISGSILSLPPESRLNRNIAVCGSQGSMKSNFCSSGRVKRNGSNTLSRSGVRNVPA